MISTITNDKTQLVTLQQSWDLLTLSWSNKLKESFKFKGMVSNGDD